MEDHQNRFKMEDDQKIQNGRRQKNSKWKTTKKFKMEDYKKIQNVRQPKNSRWNTTKKKIKIEDDKKNGR